jgi:thiamine monophosphate synthase
MAKTVHISEETHSKIEDLKEMFKKEMLLPVSINQKEAVEIAIDEAYKRRTKTVKK